MKLDELQVGDTRHALRLVALCIVLAFAGVFTVERLLARARRTFSERTGMESFVWGYGHYFVFGSAAAVGVGLAVAVDQAVGESTLSDVEAALVLTVPVALFLLTVWVLHWRHKAPGPFRAVAAPIAAAVVLATGWTGEPVLLTGLAVVGLVVACLIVHPVAIDDPDAVVALEEAVAP